MKAARIKASPLVTKSANNTRSHNLPLTGLGSLPECRAERSRCEAVASSQSAHVSGELSSRVRKSQLLKAPTEAEAAAAGGHADSLQTSDGGGAAC